MPRIVSLASAPYPARVEGLNRDIVGALQKHTARLFLTKRLPFVYTHTLQYNYNHHNPVNLAYCSFNFISVSSACLTLSYY